MSSSSSSSNRLTQPFGNLNMSDTSDPVIASINETKAEYRRLGKSGLQVSVPILGAMSFGSKAWQPWVIEEAEALPLLKAAYDKGLNTWDTANVYSNGVSEEIIGKALKQYDIPRNKVVILSKCYGYVGETPGIRGIMYGQAIAASKDYVNRGGLSRIAIFEQVEASLKRLDTPYLDLLQIHRYDAHTPIEETMEALHDLVRSGKVHYIGASSMWAYQFAMMQHVAEKYGWTKFISMQNHYNLLYREEEREMNRFCNETGVGLIPWAPLCRGHLARPPSAFGSTIRSEGESKNSMFTTGQSESDREVIKRVQELAEEHGWKMSHVALAWINKRVSSPIIGFSSVERMDEALEARGKELSEEEEKYLEEPYVSRGVQGHS
jgi:aryl-alcohol dehydrogenase-like predicted oxidoreductase